MLCAAVGLAVLAALACNASRQVAEETPAAPTATPETAATATSGVPTATPEVATSTTAPEGPTDTPAPDVSGPGGCTLNSRYVADVTVPDNTELASGTAFAKTWRVRNSGTCTWEMGTKLVFVSGNPLGGPASVAVPATAPDANTDITVNMVAPSEPGTYRSTWQLESPTGVRFGSQIYVQIVVPSPATDTPTPTATAGPPDLTITDLRVDTDDPRQGVPMRIVATLRNQGGSAAVNLYWAWRVCITAGCGFIEAPGPLTLNPGEQAVVSMEYVFGGWSTYTTEAWVDSRETVAESDETNNTRQLTIAVKPGLPDLIVESMTYDPSPPVKGQDTSVQVRVRNQGSKDAAGFKVQWWASTGAATPACTWTVAGGLVAGGAVNLSCTYVYPSWYVNITTRGVVDSDGTIAELNEGNNTLDLTIEVKQP